MGNVIYVKLDTNLAVVYVAVVGFVGTVLLCCCLKMPALELLFYICIFVLKMPALGLLFYICIFCTKEASIRVVILYLYVMY